MQIRLRNRLTILTLVPALVIAITMLAVYNTSVRELALQAEADQLAGDLAVKRHGVESWLNERLRDVAFTGARAAHLWNGTDSTAEIAALADSFVSNHPMFTAIILADDDGRILYDSIIRASALNSSVAERPYFVAARDGRAVMTRITVDRNPPTNRVIVAVPTRGSETGPAVAFAPMRLNALEPIVAPLADLTRHTTSIEAGDVRIVAPPAPRSRGGTALLRRLDTAISSSAAIVATSDGTNFIRVRLPFQSVEWELVGELPVTTALDQFQTYNTVLVAAFIAALVLGAILGRLLARAIEDPVANLAEMARHVEARRYEEALAIEIPRRAPLEVARLSGTMRRMTARLAQHVSDLERTAVTDPLTGLPNRRLFEEELRRSAELAARRDWDVAVLAVDIDHFKQINDRFGHEAGDSALALFAELLRHNIRDSDLVARVGGEEFAVLCADITAEAAADVAERIRLATAERDATISFTTSIGVAFLDRDLRGEEQGRDVMRSADRALYESKRAGRNRVTVAQ